MLNTCICVQILSGTKQVKNFILDLTYLCHTRYTHVV